MNAQDRLAKTLWEGFQQGLPVPYSFVRALPCQQAIMLAYLLVEQTEAEHFNETWFKCSTQALCQFLGWSESSVNSCLGRLKKRGALVTEIRLHPKTKERGRWIFLRRSFLDEVSKK